MNRAEQLNLYLNFVLHAVVGMMAEADAIMRAAGGSIRHVAGFLDHHKRFERAPIYRGVLLDPSKPYEANDRYTFMSWSEDRDVARWFASPLTFISQPTSEVFDHALRGYIATSDPRRVLWHYSWADVFGGVEALADLALRHPFMGADLRRQLAWSLSTQREVITAPILLSLTPADELSPSEVVALDARFSPPWIERAA